jgi:hypothetical protein
MGIRLLDLRNPADFPGKNLSLIRPDLACKNPVKTGK